MRNRDLSVATAPPWPHRLRWLTASLALAVLIALAARSPDVAFVSDSNGWWLAPEAAEGIGVEGPFEVTAHLRVTRGGGAKLAAMAEFQLFTAAGRWIASGPTTGRRWSEPVSVQLEPGDYRMMARHPRWKPAFFIGGEVEATLVIMTAADEPFGLPGRDARALARRFDVAPALDGYALILARVTPLLAIAAVLALFFVGQAGDGQARDPEGRRPRLATAIVLVHVALAGWNAAHYPLARGLDAEAHLAYARIIATSHELPPPNAGFQTYHPPLYHALAAVGIALTGTDRAAAWISTACGVAMITLIARALGGRGNIALALAALAPVLLVSEPSASNELLFAALATAMLMVAARDEPTPGSGLKLGLLAGAALLTKYTGVVFAAAVAATIADAPAPWRRRAGTLAVFLGTALTIGSPPYLDRWSRYGDPFVGNWDDGLGQSYRQPPGMRGPEYFLRFGASLYAHPFKARDASLWDSLYVSAVGDGFGRFLSTGFQHATNAALAWLALPLAVVALAGWLGCVWSPRDGHERAASYAVLLGLAAIVRFNLELPYWSAAKSVFLLGLLLPVAVSFARGRATLRGRLPRFAPLLDVAAAGFVLVALATFVFR